VSGPRERTYLGILADPDRRLRFSLTAWFYDLADVLAVALTGAVRTMMQLTEAEGR